jgi:sodium-independent sulfate anion transporter 11
VEWHFTGLQNERIRRDLLAFGFGTWDDHQQSAMEISAPSPVNAQQPAGCWKTDTLEHTEISMPSAEQQKQQQYHRGSMMMTPGNDEKAIMESWRSAACMELDVHRFSIRNSMYDPMEMDIDPYYASINLSTDPHDQLPTESYPCFHWDVDTAVRTISDRWHQKKSTQPCIGV